MLLLSCCSFFSNSLLRSSDYSSLSYSLEVSLVIYCFFSLFDKVSKKKNLDLQYTSHPHNLYLKLTLHFQIASDRSAMIPRRTKYLSPGTTLFYLFPFFFSFYTKLRRFRLCSCWRFQMWMRPVVSPSYGFPSDTSTTPLPFLRS